MENANDRSLLEALLDSWDRNNAILVNLLRALPDGGLEARASGDHPSVAQQLSHIHLVRLALVAEDAPEAARDVPGEEWAAERDPDRLATRLNESADAVREAARGRIEAGRDMDTHYDHPLLLLQHLIWHEGLPSRADQAGPRGGRSPAHGRRGGAGHLGSMDAQDIESGHLAPIPLAM